MSVCRELPCGITIPRQLFFFEQSPSTQDQFPETLNELQFSPLHSMLQVCPAAHPKFEFVQLEEPVHLTVHLPRPPSSILSQLLDPLQSMMQSWPRGQVLEIDLHVPLFLHEMSGRLSGMV